MLTAAYVAGMFCACAGSQKTGPAAAEMDDVAFIRPEPIVVAGAGFLQPDSVVYDEEQDVYFVSNINGDPAETDDNGFISTVSPDGKVVELKFIDGEKGNKTLNAPKGMAVRGRQLFVADLESIRIFDKKTGASMGRMGVSGAKYLNRLSSAPDGTIYLSDSGLVKGKAGLEGTDKAAVHSLSKWGNLQRLARGEDLNQPTGVAADNDGVWVASWTKAELLRLSKRGKRSAPVPAPTAKLDGIVRLPDGTMLLSSWEKKAVYIGHPGAEFTLVAENAPSASGIGYDSKRRRVLIPLQGENAVIIQELSGFEETAGATPDDVPLEE